MQPPKPTLLRPSPEYLAKKRSEEGKAKKAAIQPRDDSVDVALCVTGGGLVPPAEMLGVFRGFAKKEVEQRRPDACSKNALDNFDIISGASGGYLASTMHATAASTAIAHKRSSLHLAASRYCYSKCDPARYLETSRVTRPCEITPACMERLEPVSKEYGSYGSILHQPGLCCAGTEACQSQCCFPDVFWLCMAGILGAPLANRTLIFPPRTDCPHPSLALTGFPYRILTCGKCPFRARWPLACGDPAIFIEFMWHTLLDPIGIKKGMYTAASEARAHHNPRLTTHPRRRWPRLVPPVLVRRRRRPSSSPPPRWGARRRSTSGRGRSRRRPWASRPWCSIACGGERRGATARRG